MELLKLCAAEAVATCLSATCADRNAMSGKRAATDHTKAIQAERTRAAAQDYDAESVADESLPPAG